MQVGVQVIGLYFIAIPILSFFDRRKVFHITTLEIQMDLQSV